MERKEAGNYWEKRRRFCGILRKFCGRISGAIIVLRIEGLETAIKGGYSLVLLDIVMPDISGISLAKELHRQEPAPAVVLMSSIPGFSLEAWKIQAFGFIEKPYTRAHIAGMVEKYIRSL